MLLMRVPLFWGTGLTALLITLVSLAHIGKLQQPNKIIPQKWADAVTSYGAQWRAQPTCDPYSLSGYLEVNETHMHNNRWHPFIENDPGHAAGCRSPPLMASFMNQATRKPVPEIEGPVEPETEENDFGPDGRLWEDVEFAKGKTVVVFGDSVLRFNVYYFCELAGQHWETIDWNHPLSTPKPYGVAPNPLNGTIRDPDAFDREWTPKPDYGPGNAKDYPHICYIPQMDFLIIQLHHYGLDEEDYWAAKGDFIPPGTVENRIEHLLKPLIATTMSSIGPRGDGAISDTPDLIFVNSAFWDMARWAGKDGFAGRDTEQGLSVDRLRWYQERVKGAMVAIKRALPQTGIRWLTPHHPPGDGRESNGLIHVGSGGRGGARSGYSLLRVMQVNAALRGVFHDPITESLDCDYACTKERQEVMREEVLSEWGMLMLGEEAHSIDDLHQALIPGGYLWADMMLFHLRNIVRHLHTS